jgi:type II protein arginine methyltransferase
VQIVIFPPPRNRSQIAAYGRAINTCLARTPYMQFSIRLPTYDPSIFQTNSPTRSTSGEPRDRLPSPDPSSPLPSTPIRSPEPRASPSTKASEAELNATWEMWDAIRSICAYNPRLTLSELLWCSRRPGLCLTCLRCLALDLMPPLPSVPGVLSRWTAEPIRHLFIPASAFIANAKGYPVLPKGSQSFIRDIMKVRLYQSQRRASS